MKCLAAFDHSIGSYIVRRRVRVGKKVTFEKNGYFAKVPIMAPSNMLRQKFFIVEAGAMSDAFSVTANIIALLCGLLVQPPS